MCWTKKVQSRLFLNFSFCSSIIIIKRTLRAKYSSKMQFVHKPLYTRCDSTLNSLLTKCMYDVINLKQETSVINMQLL